MTRLVLATPVRALRRLLDLAFLVLALVVVAALVLARGVPLTGRSTFVVSGPSMEPAIARGSAIVVEPVAVDELRVGDVVTIRVGPEQALFTHRIVRVVERVDGRWIETKDDANAEPDPALVPAGAVVGRVATTVSGIGYVIAAMATPTGLLLAGGLAGMVLAIVLMLEAAEAEQLRQRRLLVESASGTGASGALSGAA